MAEQSYESSETQLPERDASESDEGPDDDDSQDSQDDSDEKILSEARARLQLAQEAESDLRTQALDDLTFLSGEQWPTTIREEREDEGRPCLVVNRLPQVTNQVCNDQKQNRPAIKVHPADGAANDDTAKVIQGLIRHIEYNSNAEVAYDTAFESAVESRRGFFRVRTAFASPDSFDQEIFIDSIENPLSVFFDPYSRKIDGSDATYAFVVYDLSKDDYLAEFPGSALAKNGGMDWDATGNQAPGWIKDRACRVAEYFYREYREEKIHLLSTGETVKDADLPARFAQAQMAGLSVQVTRSRMAKVPKICWVKTNGVEILDKTDWIGSYIPIIPVYGKRRFIDGKFILESLITHAKDPQRMLNYWKSAETEAIALAPRAPFVGAEGQFEGHEHVWKTANRRNHAYLEYKPKSLDGQPQGPPMRQAIEPAVGAITQAVRGASDDIKATTGIYDPTLGQISPDVSGVAIQKRNVQAQTSTYHFTDNLKHSMRHTGRILVEIIPKVYDTARTARIIGDDGTPKMVKLNQPTGETNKEGKPLIYSLEQGRYDVTVDIGPSYASKRQEAADSLMQFSQAVPQAAQYCADLIAQSMDWPGAQEIAERLRKLLPPQLMDDMKNKAVPPQVQMQMQQMGQLIDQLTQHLHDKTNLLETKQMEFEHKERIEFARIQADIEINMAKLGSQEAVELLKQELGTIKHQLEMVGMGQPMGQANQSIQQDPPAGSAGAMGAMGASGGDDPTGGQSPGSPMETP